MNCHGCGVELDPSQEEVNRSTLPLTRFWRLLLRRKRKGECVRFVAIPRRCLTRIAGPSYLVCCWPVCSLASSWGSGFRDRDGPTVQHWQGRRWHGWAPMRRLSGSSGADHYRTRSARRNQTRRNRMERSAFNDSRAGSHGDATAHGSAAGVRALGLSRHSRRVLARCGGYALLNASNIAMLTGECRGY